VGIDETLERRYGKKIAAKGVYRDPVRSTHEQFVKSRGLRWVCAMLLVEIPWASRVWALPFLSALSFCPGSFRALCHRAWQAAQEEITEWAWQLLLQIRRWYPEREIVAVADSAYASLKLLFRCRSLSKPVTFMSPAYAWMPRSTSRPRHATPPSEREASPQGCSRVSACPTFLRWLKIQTPSGNSLRSPTGMGAGSAWLKLLPRRPCGTARAHSLCLLRWFWCAIRKKSSRPRPSCVPTLEL